MMLKLSHQIEIFYIFFFWLGPQHPQANADQDHAQHRDPLRQDGPVLGRMHLVRVDYVGTGDFNCNLGSSINDVMQIVNNHAMVCGG